ncbi:hypothetical protein chiPu_0024424 [Chiloscyllium punctatum]|uniref:Uncharacterized protein n=1 Tax=Chiloscyllium punctatum TaxID=137246 RepID=A0A401TBW2_CHIPU|nr:hypothetical protein [Chiloscyllium punctatum]
MTTSSSSSTTSSSSFTDLEQSFVMSRTCQEQGESSSPAPGTPSRSQPPARSGQRASFYQDGEEEEEEEAPSQPGAQRTQFPEGFEPLRSQAAAASIKLQSSAIVRNPFMSPLLATDDMLQGLPPVHLVVSVTLRCSPFTPPSPHLRLGDPFTPAPPP